MSFRDPGLYSLFDECCDGRQPEIEYEGFPLPQPCCVYLTADFASVVAVHGLNFKGTPDHARETWMNGGKLWLRDFLPTRLPRPARVMLFAYNSSPAIGAAARKLDDHAKTLLHWLWLKREASCPTSILLSVFLLTK